MLSPRPCCPPEHLTTFKSEGQELPGEKWPALRWGACLPSLTLSLRTTSQKERQLQSQLLKTFSALGAGIDWGHRGKQQRVCHQEAVGLQQLD